MQSETRVRLLDHFRKKIGVPAVFGGLISSNGEADFDVVGVRRRDHFDKAAINDRIHIGSCLKMITAYLYGTFVAEHRADWKMPVIDLFPDLTDSIADGWRQRTVEELFYCLSGMVANPPNRYLNSGFSDTRPLQEQRTEWTELAFSKPPHKPGRFVYSNMSYIVMGAAIDRISGNSFESELETRLFEPLGITSAGFGPPPEVWGHAPGVVIGGMALFKGKPADPSDNESDNSPALSSAGTLHLNCQDWASLLRLFQVESNLGIVDNKIVERILQVPKNRSAQMAMGWVPMDDDILSYAAQGSNVRWSATALMDDARRHTAFVVCNDGRSRVLQESVSLARKLLKP